MEQVLNVLLTLFGSATSFYIVAALIVFLQCFYDPDFLWNRKKALILGILTIIEAITGNLMNDNPFISGLLLIAYCIIPIYDYQGKKIRAMFRFFCFYFLASMSSGTAGMIGMYFFSPNYDPETSDMNDTELLLYCVILTLFFGFVFHYLRHRLCKEKIFVPCGVREKIFSIVYSIFSFILCIVIIVSGRDGRATLVIMAFCMMFFSVGLPIFVYSARISDYYRERTHYQETYLQAELAHFQQYKQAQEETRRFRHDIRNNLLCMNEMLRSGRTEEASEYLQNLLDTADTLSVKYVSGDEILDCIISSKAGVMAQKGIPFQMDGILAGGLPWNPIDVCSVFANALDNAIEACEKLPPEQRMINMKLKATPQFWFVRIENPVTNEVNVSRLFHEKGGYTSKSNAGHHGIGTYNMKHTVESYGGIVKAECRDHQFMLELIIDKSSSA